MQETQRRTNEQRSEATKTALLNAARKLFLAKGFAETGTPKIVAAAKVTRGALYHHFQDKHDLLRAILVREADSVARRIAATAAADPLDALLEGARRYFDAMAKPGRARLLLIEGPAALGPSVMAEIHARTGSAELRAGLAALSRAGTPFPVDAMTDVLSAGFDAATLRIAEGGDPEAYLHAIEHLLVGLRDR